MHHTLISTIEKIVTLTPLEVELIKQSFKEVKLAKGDFFLKEGTICKYVGFIYKGLVRYFVYKNGDESTFEFTKEGDFISDYTSFMDQTVSLQNIEAVEETIIYIIDRNKLLHLYATLTHGNLIGRKIIERRFGIMVNQLLAVYMQSNEKRYESFLEQYKDINQRIPQYLIASFVGVQPPSLSRIRKRLT